MADMTQRAAIRQAIADLDVIDVVVCAAGIVIPKPIAEQTDEDFAGRST